MTGRWTCCDRSNRRPAVEKNSNTGTDIRSARGIMETVGIGRLAMRGCSSACPPYSPTKEPRGRALLPGRTTVWSRAVGESGHHYKGGYDGEARTPGLQQGTEDSERLQRAP